MSLFQSIYEVKVPFEDLDPMNIVWHGNYMRYMEHARCQLLSELNYTYMDMKADGFAYPIAKMNVKYIKPAVFEDILCVKVDVISVEPSLDMKYVIYNKATNEKIFEASTMQIGININTGQTVYTPPKGLVEAFLRVNHDEKV